MVHLALKTRKIADSADTARDARRAGEQGERSFRGKLGVRFALYWVMFAAIAAVANLAFSIALAMNVAPQANRDGIRFNLVILLLGIALSASIGAIAPAWWRRAMALLAIGPMPILLVTSDNAAAGAATILLVFVASWLGRRLVTALLGRCDLVTGWVISATFGLCVIATYGYVAGMLGVLRPYVTWPLLALVALGLIGTERTRLRRETRVAAIWLARPTGRRPLHFVLAGAALACLWLNLLGALAPETRPDAVRQRLVTAAQFARNGNLQPTDPDLFVAKDPALGEVIYAVLLTISPLQGAKLLHFLVGLLCTGAVFALGQHLGGRFAGGVAAFAFYSTLMTAYLSQTAYLDFFIALFAVTAALLVLRREPNWRAAAAAGICIGFAMAVKLHFGYVAIGLGIVAGLVAIRHRGFRRASAIGAILSGAAMLAAAPWFARSYILQGAIPGLSLGTTALTSGQNEQASVLFDIKTYGYGRSIWNLLAIPLTTTLASREFGGGQLDAAVFGGHIGYLLLGLVPLFFVIRQRWRTVALLAGVAVATLLWFYTAQYLRYGLPILALLCVVGGVAYVGAWQRLSDARSRAALNLLLGVVALAGVGIRAQMPDTAHRLALGLQGREEYLTEHLSEAGAGSYANLRSLDDDPSVTRVLAMYDGARLYTRARVSTPFTSGANLAFAGDEHLVLQRLREGGYSHILVDRRIWVGPTLGWERITVINEDFLRRHTVLVGGGDYSYLYRLLLPNETGGGTWAQGRELLPNGGFELGGVTPSDWAIAGNPLYDRAGGKSRGGARAIRLAGQDELGATVTVRPGVSYLLSSATQSETGYAFAWSRIEWRDGVGRVIAVSDENLPVSTNAYHAFSMLAVAPTGAATATIAIKAIGHPVWIDDLSFRSVPADVTGSNPATGHGGIR